MEAALGEVQVTQAQPGKKEKRFQCPHCQRAFARLEHLQRHERIRKLVESDRKLSLTFFEDSGVKPFSCSECNYSFTRRYEIFSSHIPMAYIDLKRSACSP